MADAFDPTDERVVECQCQHSRFINKVNSCFLNKLRPDNILFCHKIGNRMREIGERLAEIAEERMKFHLHEVVSERQNEVIEKRQTGSIVTQSQVYERDEDKEKVVQYLMRTVASHDDISVYPIVGIGGLGKTTLAQLVYNDERVRMHFEPRIWVCISGDFSVRRVIKAVIESVTGIACEDLDLDPLQRRLQSALNGKRYLLVLDDVWNDDQEKWDRVKYVLACGSNGASIIVTTRIKRVASIMGTLPLHHLSGLSGEGCWSLFRERAFGHEKEERPNLVTIGKEIVKKCRGVPLAVKSLGSLMRYKNEEHEWLSVKESELWNLPQDENSILPALRMSYSHLPSTMRRCFAYCAIYPKDFEIPREQLIHLWIANGFIPSNGKIELENIGNEICNELYWRSFFQDVETSGNRVSFKMHDLIHDLAQSILEDECCIMKGQCSNNISRAIHHVRMKTDFWLPHTGSKALKEGETLRTLIVESTSTSSSHKLPSDFSRLTSLRAFDARNTKLMKLPSSVSHLKHLRYLDLSGNPIQVLPESICGLLNLQILNLEGCTNLQQLPKHMKHLKNLLHLNLKCCGRLSQMPPKIGQITCLRTLPLFIVGKRTGFRLSELKELKLGGELLIRDLNRVGNVMHAKEANLVGKSNLRSLYLIWKDDNEIEQQKNVEMILEALEPHPNIQHLAIGGYKGTKFPLWMRAQILSDVVSITFSGCKNCSQLPLLGQLPSLRFLTLNGMASVLYIDHNFQDGIMMRGFPFLKDLVLHDLPSLQRLSREDDRELFPRLTRIRISKCPKLSLSCLPSVQDLKVTHCNELLRSITKLKSLTDLYVSFDGGSHYVPHGILQNLTSLNALKSLYISHCSALESFPEQGLEGLNQLKHLCLYKCEDLTSLPEGFQHLSSLENLCLIGCPKLVALPDGIKHLRSLQCLTISGGESGIIYGHYPENFLLAYRGNGCESMGCIKLAVLPEALRHIPALHSLCICSYPNLASLPHWLADLTSLQSFHIINCPSLLSLPVSIQSLSNLQKLEISYCPKLFKRCEKEIGEDWYKIAHVPNIDLYLQSEYLPQIEAQKTNCCINLRHVMR